MNSTPSFRLRLFSSPSLATGEGTPLEGSAAQRHRIALLAMLARSKADGVSREVLMGHLWPESDIDQARNLLKVSTYALRQALGQEAIVTVGERLRLDAERVDVDVAAFEAALASGDLERAVGLYTGPFLEGFFLGDAPEFERWTDRERAELEEAFAGALERLATGASARGDRAGAVQWWKRRAALDPLDSRVALELMAALASVGNRAAALQHGRLHAALLRDELGIEPPVELQRFAERLPTETAPSIELRSADTVPVSAASDATADAAKEVMAAAERRPPRLRLAAIGLFVGVLAAIALAVVRPWSRIDAANSSAEPARTASVVAAELTERATRLEVMRSDSTAREALTLARRAAELDPAFAGAHAALSRLYLRISPPENTVMTMAERSALARRHASVAVALDPSFAPGHAALGIASMLGYQLEEAEVHLRRSAELDPGVALTHEFLSQLYVFMGRFEDALDEGRRAVEIDPLQPTARAELARGLLVNGRCDEALAELKTLEGLDPPLLRAGPIAAQCHLMRGMPEEAIAAVAPGRLLTGARGRAVWAHVLARAGQRAEASNVLAELIEEGRDAFWVAIVYAGLDDLDQAFAWLDRALVDHSLTGEINEPLFASLHADPRFRALMSRLGSDVR